VRLIFDDTGALAARIPIRGQIDVWIVIIKLIGNAFLKAIMPGCEEVVGPGGVWVAVPTEQLYAGPAACAGLSNIANQRWVDRAACYQPLSLNKQIN